MNDHRTEKTEFPSWMCQEEDYTPSGDKEAFLTKSTKSVLSVLSKLRLNKIAARWPAKAVAQFYFY